MDTANARKGELIALITTITEFTAAPACRAGVSRRWEHETEMTSSKPTKRTRPGAACSRSPDGPPGDLRLPARPPCHQRPDLPGRHRSRHRPRQGQNSPAPSASSAGRSARRAFPPSSRNTSAPRSRPTSPAGRTSTRSAGTGLTRGPSNEPATTPTASSGPVAARESATPDPRPSNSPTSAASASQHDQFTVSGIVSSPVCLVPADG